MTVPIPQKTELASCKTLGILARSPGGARFCAHSAALCLWTQADSIILKRCEALTTARQRLAPQASYQLDDH